MDRWKNGPHFSSLSLYSRFPSVILLTDLTVAFARTSCLKHILHHCFVTHLDVSHGRQQQQRFQQGRKQRQPETYSLQIFPCMHISFRFYHSVSFLVKGITPSVFSIVFFLLLPDNLPIIIEVVSVLVVPLAFLRLHDRRVVPVLPGIKKRCRHHGNQHEKCNKDYHVVL